MPLSDGLRMTTPEVVVKIRTRRQIDGITPVLLAVQEDGSIDFDNLAENVLRTSASGLTPAVNVELGYIERLSPEERKQVLDVTADVMVTGTFVAGAVCASDSIDSYLESVSEIVGAGGTPIVFPSPFLNRQPTTELVNVFHRLGDESPSLLAFEADPAVVKDGKLFSFDAIRELIQIPKICGLRHASLNRKLEWERLGLRDDLRPDFRIYSGNEIAVDMVMYGSDYFLSVSACAPEAFALRDRYWRSGDARFYELNDVLQSLGMLIFRPPFAASRHSAAQMLKLRGRIDHDRSWPEEPKRPESDIEILRKIMDRLDQLLHAGHIHS